MNKLKTYMFTYPYKGDEYGFTIPAYSEEEALDRLKALAFTKYDGELVAKIPVAPSWLSRLFGRTGA